VSIREAVATSLGQIGKASDQALDALRKLLKDSNEEVRSEAALSLGLFGKDAYEVIPDLMRCMKDPNWNVRTSIKRYMARNPDHNVRLAFLLDAIYSSSTSSRRVHCAATLDQQPKDFL
ncbi:MAG: HEAT repeat domain-containing protein, partial [Acidobacteriota bacterium]